MANTYTQIHIQVVFAVQNRQSLIAQAWKEELYRYITTIVQASGHKLLQINGMPDHLHVLIGMRPTQALSELVQHIKQDSSKWINAKGLVRGRFSWQEGYGAFSYSNRDVPNVIAYIQNQEEHHRVRSFHQEYVDFLKDFEIEHDERYIFKDIE
ncbi:MAG: IS200/IS605 family transposase [Flavobacteriales bacterium]|nr:IS200/IS605 family transposase [Flavobacteriales bacterium]